MRVTVWNEFRHEKENETVKAIYPDGMHQVIADFLTAAGHNGMGKIFYFRPDHEIYPTCTAWLYQNNLTTDDAISLPNAMGAKLYFNSSLEQSDLYHKTAPH